MSVEDILNQKEVCEYFKIARSTLYYFINHYDFPRPIKLGLRTARWNKKEIIEWYKKKGFDL